MAKFLYKHRRGSVSDWANKGDEIIPLEGEIVIELDEENNLHKLKIGDGVHTYSQLKYLQAGDEIVTQVLAEVKPRVVTIELASNWTKVNDGKYSQTIAIDDITAHSRLDLQPSADMIAEFKQLGLVFVTENNGGVATVYSIGNMPSQTYTMQATIVETECNGEDTCVVGDTIGIPVAQTDIDNMSKKITNLETSVSSPYNFKGSTTYNALPTSNNTINDTYYCTDLKTRYTWNGEAWYQSSLNESDYEDELSRVKTVAVSDTEPTDENVVVWVNEEEDSETVTYLTSDDIAQELGDSEKKVLSQKATTDTVTTYAKIINEGKIGYYVDGYYAYADCSFITSDIYRSSPFLPVVFFERLKPFARIAPNFLSYKNNGVYVGYSIGEQFYNPNQEEVAPFAFDEFALGVHIFHDSNYDKQWFEKAPDHKDFERIYTGKLEWLDGYYNLLSNGDFAPSDVYKCSNYLPLYLYYTISGLELLFADTNSVMTYKYNNAYVGYRKGNNFYDPNGAITTPMVFDEFALVVKLETTDIEKINVVSFDNAKYRHSNLWGKKLGVIGDSIAYGAGFAGGYGGIIADMYNMRVCNKSASGATLVPTNGLSEILPQINMLDGDCDFIILEGGFNDSWKNNPIGEYNASFETPTADGTFYGNLNYLLYQATRKFNGRKICFVIVHQSRTQYSVANNSEYYHATVKLCNKWGIPIVDLNKNCPPLGMVGANHPLYYEYTNLLGSADGVHPNEKGYRKYYVPQIVGCLESL